MTTGGPPLSWRHVAIGAVLEAEDAAAVLLTAARRRAAIPATRYAELAAAARRRLVTTAERGAVEYARGQRRTAELVDALAAMVAASPVVDRVVDVQVDRVLRPLVGAVLDEVLALLEAEPERIRSLIKGQRESMVDELVGRIRTGAAVSDAAVDRWTARVFRRTLQPAPAQPDHP
ncbi:hypothetical protein [Phytohabitans rumicis]|uniref:Uncharacterized protein n=1 Tax=Phytohabitans rumicis TaxID=1076125 RepID=A0A6V8LTI5_9ACTN|nr:hypothetical protein [Phytohabitans rumicis]GFJ96065.1 hypothetical protein Prum_097070 [Phytohabitans rumicis]